MVKRIWLGLVLMALTSNRRPFVWFNLHDPCRTTAEEIERCAQGMRGLTAVACWDPE